jgi:hypothetical protein
VTAALPILDVRGCRLEHQSKPPVDARAITVRLLALRNSVLVGNCERVLLSLSEARVAGRLACRGARLSNKSGPTLVADGIQVDQEVFLDDGFIAEGAGENGVVRLSGARVGGQLSCRGARLSNTSGPAIRRRQAPG